MAVLAAGTFIESTHGTDAARILVYESFWFSLLLVFLAVNLAAAALTRLPWKKKHIGFVITHLGIIIILAGSLVTQRSMIDGQMALTEGETDAYLNLSQPLLYVYSKKAGTDHIFYLKKHAFAWEGRQALDSRDLPLPFKLHVTAYYPKAKAAESILPAESGPAAVKILLRNSFINQTQWLIENDEQLGLVQMGPAKLRFTDKLLKESAAEASPSARYLEIETQGSPVQIPLADSVSLPAEFSVEGTEYKITVMKIFKNAMVHGKELIEHPGSEDNPAVQFTLSGPGVEERHTAFAKYPDFPTVHGMKPSASGFKIFYRLPGSGSKGQSHELRFVRTETGLQAQVQTGREVRNLKTETGVEMPLGWMDLHCKIEEYLPHAKRHYQFTPEPEYSEAASPALRVEIQNGQESRSLWLGQGMKETLTENGEEYDFVFGQQRVPAGFRLTLKDFRLEHYPGTENPASYESDVTLKDDSRGVVRDATISMNNPLVYRGYRIYQSGYSQEQGSPEVSIFAVGRDPGVPVKYLGALIMVGGIITMFYTRRAPPAPKQESAK